ncbi:MAG: hypothetical protein KGV44_07120 [Flavobacteriaceae bacterium]|nr:hypothetical protein [Flavobacteriaceae bacterium]
MDLPKFLLGDNTDYSEEVFIIHTDFPRFIINLANDDITLLEDVKDSEQADLEAEMKQLIQQAYDFYDREIQRFNE